MAVRQLIDCQEYPVTKGDIINKGFDCKAADERFVAYLNNLSQIMGCPRSTGDIITSCTFLQLIPIENISILVAAQFMVEF